MKVCIFGVLLFSCIVLTSCSENKTEANDINTRIRIDKSLSKSDQTYLSSKISKDPKICNQVAKNKQTQCLINVYTNIAVETNDAMPCNNLDPNFRFNCTANIAIKLKKLDICDSVKPDSLVYRCKELTVKQIAIDTNNTEICDKFDFQGNQYLEAWVPKARCIEQTAFCNMNESLCQDAACKETVKKIKEKGDLGGIICDLRPSINV